jgi:hypothetical protein
MPPVKSIGVHPKPVKAPAQSPVQNNFLDWETLLNGEKVASASPAIRAKNGAKKAINTAAISIVPPLKFLVSVVRAAAS